jgi:hypothetical protein
LPQCQNFRSIRIIKFSQFFRFPFGRTRAVDNIERGAIMKSRRDVIKIVLLGFAAIVLFSALLAGAQQRQMESMCGMHGMHGMAADHRSDMATIHALFADREKIERKVTTLPDGVETTTESDDPKVAARIVEHVYAMKNRMEKQQPIHTCDPLFAELFANASNIRIDISKSSRGVIVKETSGDPNVVKLIQAHADTVSEFLNKGMPAMHQRALPNRSHRPRITRITQIRNPRFMLFLLPKSV